MIKILKNKFFIGVLVAVLAVFTFSLDANALVAINTTSATDVCPDGSYDTSTGLPCGTMNPPILGVLELLPYGCDLGVGTVYSPETGQSCSINGVSVTPPIVMMPPYDANGCKAGSPYSMLTGNKCSTSVTTTGGLSAGVCTNGALFNIITGVKCSNISTGSDISINPQNTIPVKQVVIDGCTGVNKFSTTTGQPCSGMAINPRPMEYDCNVAKNAYCAGLQITSTSDIKGIQAILNSVLGSDLPVALTVDGKRGPRTIAAIKMFQKKAGLSSIDGIVGIRTMAKLNASIQ